MFEPTYSLEGHDEELSLGQVRTLARNDVNEYVYILRRLPLTARRRLGARMALHDQLLSLLLQMANVADGDHARMVELVERRAGVVEQLELRPYRQATKARLLPGCEGAPEESSERR